MSELANKVGPELVQCTVCGQLKAPWGRSAPPEMHPCNWDCIGYDQDPKPSSLWPGETEEACQNELASRVEQLELQDARWRETAADHVDLVHAHEALDIEAAGLRKRVEQLEAELAEAKEALETFYRWTETDHRQRAPVGKILGMLHDIIPNAVEELSLELTRRSKP